MKYIFFFCIIFVLTNFTEQQLVVLKPSVKHNDKSHEPVQLDPSSAAIKISSGEQTLVGPVLSEESCTEEEKGSDNNKVQETPQEQQYLAEGSKDGDASAENKSKDDPVFIVQIPSKHPKKIGEDDKTPHWHRWLSEIAAGNNGDFSGTNPDIYQPDAYPHLGRRFVLQYPYTEEVKNIMVAPDNKEIIPIQAPLEIVKKVVKQSALEEAAKPQDHTQDLIRKKILRTGDYWNAVWVEDVDPKSALRMSKNPVLGVIKAKIKPGSEFYNMVASMKKISPRLLYIINDKEN